MFCPFLSILASEKILTCVLFLPELNFFHLQTKYLCQNKDSQFYREKTKEGAKETLQGKIWNQQISQA